MFQLARREGEARDVGAGVDQLTAQRGRQTLRDWGLDGVRVPISPLSRQRSYCTVVVRRDLVGSRRLAQSEDLARWAARTSLLPSLRFVDGIGRPPASVGCAGCAYHQRVALVGRRRPESGRLGIDWRRKFSTEDG